MPDISCCGCICSDCVDFINGKCIGCDKNTGKPYWIDTVEIEQCPFYTCCINDKQYSHCGQCNKMPCKLFYDFNDPAITKEELEKSINDRINILKNA